MHDELVVRIVKVEGELKPYINVHMKGPVPPLQVALSEAALRATCTLRGEAGESAYSLLSPHMLT